MAKDHASSSPWLCECILFPSKEQRDWFKFKIPEATIVSVKRFDPKELKPFDKVLVRDNEDQQWGINLFSSLYYSGVKCLHEKWNWCIPYNDKTKDLVGTYNDCPDYYKWWED